MLALFVRTNCVSWRKQTWIVRLLCRSRSRNVIPLRLRLRFTGQLRQLFMFLVRLSSWRLSKGKGWPSRCSPGLKRSPSWPASTRSAGSSSINRFTPPRRLSAQPSHPQVDPTTSSSTYRSPKLGCGNWSWVIRQLRKDCSFGPYNRAWPLNRLILKTGGNGVGCKPAPQASAGSSGTSPSSSMSPRGPSASGWRPPAVKVRPPCLRPPRPSPPSSAWISCASFLTSCRMGRKPTAFAVRSGPAPASPRVIQEEFGVSYHPGHVSRLLKELHWTPQLPERHPARRAGDRAMASRGLGLGSRQRPAASAAPWFSWMNRASTSCLARSGPDVPEGHTPVLHEWQTRDHLSVMGGVTPEGKIYTLMRQEGA